MRKFQFTMESALRLREQQEEQALERLADAAQAARDARDAVTATEQQMQVALDAVSADVRFVTQRELYLHRLEVTIREQRWAATEARDVLTRARHAAARAQANRKAIERLREQQITEWRQELSREEDRVLNEAAMTRAFQEARTT